MPFMQRHEPIACGRNSYTNQVSKLPDSLPLSVRIPELMTKVQETLTVS